jgi:hypothetical protein
VSWSVHTPNLKDHLFCVLSLQVRKLEPRKIKQLIRSQTSSAKFGIQALVYLNIQLKLLTAKSCNQYSFQISLWTIFQQLSERCSSILFNISEFPGTNSHETFFLAFFFI